MENEAKIFNINDISKMPFVIKVNGENFFFNLWVTAWDKFAIGYKSPDRKNTIISAVIDENLKIDSPDDIKKYIEKYVDVIDGKKYIKTILSVKSFSMAFNAILKIIPLIEEETEKIQ